MKTRRMCAAALGTAAIALGVPAMAGAHPMGCATSSFSGLFTFCPKAEQGALGNNRLAKTTFGETAADDLQLVTTLEKPEGWGASATNSDLAFWGDYAFQGNYNGFQIIDISEPHAPKVVAKKDCPGSQNDISVYKNLVVTSTDSVRNTSACENNTSASSTSIPYLTNQAWEGIRIFDWTDPADPKLVGAVKTKCGSHTHTTIPEPDKNRLIVYISSYSPGANPNCLPPHDLISVVEIPLDAPQNAKVIAEPVLFPLVEGGGQSSTSGCHDITAYPAFDIAAGACMGEGILMDISDPAAPKKIATMTDANFSFWHSATFSDDATKVIFTDELGGGTSARCTSAYGPTQGADAIYDISNRTAPVKLSYFKIPRIQTTQENCVSHNGNLIPHPTRDLFVQSWYQGGTAVIDFTDPENPKEVAYFDRGPISPTQLVSGGHWSSYWYNGTIFANEIYRGFDVLEFSNDVSGVRVPYLNAQTQEPLPKPSKRKRRR